MPRPASTWATQPFAVMLGDDIMDEHSTVLTAMIDAHAAARAASVIACKQFPLEEISSYGSSPTTRSATACCR